MKKCLNCKKLVKNKYCNVSCQNKHYGKKRINLKYGKFNFFDVECDYCKKEFKIKEREKLFPEKIKYFCSRKCSNIRKWNNLDKKKKSDGLIRYYNILGRILDKEQICCGCEKRFKHKILRKYCSDECRNKRFKELGKINGLKSAHKQSKRSKNEIYFAELCNSNFKNIKLNENIFNGWDADIILEDYKIAILWNGNWHHKKITKKHSLKQVQNRDKIKINEIIKCGYIPYIINDYGKFNIKFVESEYEKLKIHCGLY